MIHVQAYKTFMSLTLQSHLKEATALLFEGCIKHNIDPTVFRAFFGLMADLDRAKAILAGESPDSNSLRLISLDTLSDLMVQISGILQQARLTDGSLFDTFQPYNETLVGPLKNKKKEERKAILIVVLFF